MAKNVFQLHSIISFSILDCFFFVWILLDCLLHDLLVCDGDALGAHLNHKSDLLLLWGYCWIVCFMTCLCVMEMHSCPLDSQASFLAFLGKLCNRFFLAFFGLLFCFVTLAVQVSLPSIMGQCDQQFTLCV